MKIQGPWFKSIKNYGMKRVDYSPKGKGIHVNTQGWALSLEALGVSGVDGKKKKGTENRTPWEVGLLTSQWGVERIFLQSNKGL